MKFQGDEFRSAARGAGVIILSAGFLDAALVATTPLLPGISVILVGGGLVAFASVSPEPKETSKPDADKASTHKE